MGVGSYKSPLPEAKEGKAPLQIPQSTNPTNIYTRTCSTSTAPPMDLPASATQLATTWAPKKQLRVIVGADAYKAIMVKIKAYEEKRFEGGTE